MNRPTTAREALVVEAIADVAHLLDRLEALVPALDEARLAQLQTGAALVRQAEDFDKRMRLMSDHARKVTGEYIVRRANEAAFKAADEQARAMRKAAREVFQAELAVAVQQLVVPLQRIAQQASQPWQAWLMPVATALLASVATWACAAWLWR